MGLMTRKQPARKGKKKEPAREQRIDMEIVVDCYGAQEQAMGWFYYLEDNLKFPFSATCVRKRDISPLKIKEKVDVFGMPTETECEREMFVTIMWEGRQFSVPLDQLQCVRCDRKTRRAVEDWLYWVRQGYQFG